MHHATQLHRTSHDEACESIAIGSPRPPAAVQIDIAKYQAMIDDQRLSEEEREELVLAIWSLLMIVTDLGIKLETVES